MDNLVQKIAEFMVTFAVIENLNLGAIIISLRLALGGFVRGAKTAITFSKVSRGNGIKGN